MIRWENGYLCSRCFSQFDTNTMICPECGHDDHYSVLPDAVKTGTVLSDRFLIGCTLRRDILGFTYAAWDIRTGSRVEVTEYFPQGISGRGSDGLSVLPEPGWEDTFYMGRDAFHDEAVSYALRAGIPNAAHTLGFFTAGTACCVSEETDGIPLSEYIARQGGKLESKKAKELLSSLAPAIDALHSKDRFHGDICPENIMVNQGSCTLTGFGETKAKLRAACGIKSDFDTPSGMTEQANDIRLLALTYYCAVTGRAMGSGDFDPAAPDMRGLPDRTGAVIKRALRGGSLKTASAFFSAFDSPLPDMKNIREEIKNDIKIPGWMKDPGETMTVNESQINNYVNHNQPVPQNQISPTELRRSENELEGKTQKISKNAVLAALASLALLALIAVFALGGAFKNSKNTKKDTSADSDTSISSDAQNEPEITNTPVIIPEIRFVTDDIEINVGDIVETEIEIKPEEAENAEVIYTSSDESIAVVDENGTVMGTAAGNAEITAEIEYDGDKYTDKINVTVLKIETELLVNKDYVNAAAEGGPHTVSVSANYDWDFECDAEWININKNNDGLLMFIDRNRGDARDTVITITCEEKTFKVYVNQERGLFELNDVVEIEIGDMKYHRVTGYISIILKVTNISDQYIEDVDWSLYLYNSGGIETFSWDFEDYVDLAPGETAELEWHGLSAYTAKLSAQIDTVYTYDRIIKEGDVSIETPLR